MATPELALIPTGFKAGKVYSVLPESGVGDFAFTRASAATRINSNGLLEVAQYSIGGELITNGDFATDSDWALGTGWAYGTNNITSDGANANAIAYQNNIFEAGKNYLITFEITAYTSGVLRIRDNSILLPTNYTSLGTHTLTLNASETGFFAFHNYSSFIGSIDNVSVIEWAINDVPRLEYPLIDGVVNGCPSLLLENQATNLITYPISFGASYWTKSGANIEGDASTAGSELITSQNDRDFSSGNIGNWAANTPLSDGDGTGAYSTFDTDNSIKLTMGTGSYLQARLPSTFATTFIQGNTYKFSARVYITNASVKKSVEIGASSMDGGIALHTLVGDTWTTISVYFTAGADVTGNFDIGWGNVTGAPTSGDIMYITDVSIKEVQGYSSPSVDFPTSAFKLVEGTSTGEHWVSTSNVAVVNGDNYTGSIYAKKGDYDYIQLTYSIAISGGTKYANFNLNTGVVEVEQNGTAKIESMPNGWYKCSFTITATATANGLFLASLIQSASSTRLKTYTGDGTSGVYIFMAQLEQGSYATSPTLTSLTAEGTTTTRVAEVCNGAGDASTFNDSEGVLYAEISALADDLTLRQISLSDGTLSNQLVIYYGNGSNKIFYYLSVGGVAQVNDSVIINDIVSFNKIAFKYKQNDFALWINGVNLLSDSSGNTYSPSTLSELNLTNGQGGDEFYGKTKQIQYFNTVLTSAELETLTSWTSFISMANAQQYSII